MALLAPMPMASIIAATAVNAGSRRSTRAAYRKSCQRVIMDVGRWRRAVVSLTGNEGRGLPGGAADFPQSAHAEAVKDNRAQVNIVGKAQGINLGAQVGMIVN